MIFYRRSAVARRRGAPAPGRAWRRRLGDAGGEPAAAAWALGARPTRAPRAAPRPAAGDI